MSHTYWPLGLSCQSRQTSLARKRANLGVCTGMCLVFLGVSLTLPSAVRAADLDVSDWPAVLAEAKGQTVYFHAWGGSPRINAYIDWAAQEVDMRYGVSVEHVKVSDTANVVSQIIAEKAAGQEEGGSVDLVWINGENFASLKQKDLLLPMSWAPDLPNYAFADVKGKPTLTTDFTVPTDGLESPWGMAQLSFYYDSAITKTLPGSAAELLAWAKKNPGRFAYPKPPDFLGSTFLKQLALELADDPSVLSQPVTDATYQPVADKLFAYLDALHPVLWRSGRAFPDNVSSLQNLLADGEIEIAFTFNPGDASSAIANDELPETVRSFTFKEGTIGNSHFVSIPFNANAKAGALVLADFLLSPEAQARKQDPAIWGDPTVLDITSLPEQDKALFDALDLGIATLKPEELGPALPEPHASWMERLEAEWAERYGA